MKRVIGIVCAFVLCICMFAGCSSTNGPASTTTSPVTTDSPSPVTTDSPSETKTDSPTVVTLVYGDTKTAVTADDFSAKSITQTVTDPNLGKTYDFVGVTLSDLMEMAGATDCTSITVVASDKMSTTITAEDAANYPIMLANAYADGKDISAGSGGPVKLVFPYDQYSDLESKYAADTWMWYVIEVDFAK